MFVSVVASAPSVTQPEARGSVIPYRRPVDEGGSAARSRAFYRRLGPAGLAIRTKPEWDAQIVTALLALLPATGRVLDVGCGYGRIAIPLAGRGFAVTGIDIAPNLLRAARREAAQLGVTVRFDQGSMTRLPYPSGGFDVVLSLWTAFYELLEEAEQIAALCEMGRVLRPGGLGIVEGPVFAPATPGEIASGARSGPKDRVVTDLVAGHRLRYVAHDAASLERLSEAAGVRERQVNVREWAGRERQLLIFRGPEDLSDAAKLRA